MKDYLIRGYEPEALFRFFEDIAAIPHGSGNEAGIADYLEKFAAERELELYRDELNNVLIKKPASEGMESQPAILLQGHTDMVCEKNADVDHDFANDPLALYIENGILRARGTTLGADNGVAVAVMLALLDDESLRHPPLECLFTVQEEVGLIGAGGFDYSKISARRMINMDSEGEGIAVVGCAGGCRSDISIPVEFVPAAGEAMTLTISGLMGGHSGADIHLGRANANMLMGRLLLALRRNADYNLIELRGGLLDNAIPRECVAVITTADFESMRERAIAFAAELAGELIADDCEFVFTCARADRPERMMNCASTRLVADAVGTAINGVIKMSCDIDGLVEYSRNLGVIRTGEQCVELVFSSRSSVEHQIDASIDYLDALCELCGGSVEHYSRYPGWKYSRVSPLREKYVAVAERIFGKKPMVVAIHAGLECGIIKSNIPDMDIISIGPEMRNIHTPDECLDIASLSRFWQVILGILE